MSDDLGQEREEDLMFDLGVSFEDAKDLAEFPLLPPRVYEMEVVGLHKYTGEDGKETIERLTERGERMLTWILMPTDADDPRHNKLKLMHNTNIEGAGFPFFTRFCEAVGYAWTGKGFKPSSLIGKKGRFIVGIEKIKKGDRTGEDRNVLKPIPLKKG